MSTRLYTTCWICGGRVSPWQGMCRDVRNDGSEIWAHADADDRRASTNQASRKDQP